MAFGTPIVQHKPATGSSLVPAVTFTSPPTQGNLLVAAVYCAPGGSTPVITMTSAGWTALTAAGTAAKAIRLFWKIAGAGESSTVTAAVSTSSPWAMAIAEYPAVGYTVNAPTENAQSNISGTTTTPTVTPAAGRPALVLGWIAESITSTWSTEKVNASATGVTAEERPTRVGASGTLFDLAVASTTGTYAGSATPGSAGAGAGAIAVFTATITYTDAPTGALTLGGSLAEAKTGADAQTGAVTLGGSVTEAKTGADAQTGALVLSGSLTEAKRGADSPTGALTLGGSVSEHLTRSGSPTGAFTLGGSCTQALTRAGAPAGALTLTGTLSELKTYSDVPIGALTLGGTIVESWVHTVGIDARVAISTAPVTPVALAELVLTGCAVTDAPTTPVALGETALTGCVVSDAPTTPVGLSDAPLD